MNSDVMRFEAMFCRNVSKYQVAQWHFPNVKPVYLATFRPIWDSDVLTV